MLKPSDFQKRFLRLILLAWTVPAVFGLSFLIYIKMFSLDQMVDILLSPIEPVFVISALVLAYLYFKKSIQNLILYLEDPENSSLEDAILVIQRFPRQFWLSFLLYLVIAPVTVIYSAELYSDFTASPIDWFRINLVSLIVSIIVGLPIFFLILDLFGKIIVNIPISKPIVTIKTKVILIGALVPLLIDTMLVQYYWTRTGFFDTETFIIWLALEILAIIGSIIFAKSFGQSLQPLQFAIKENDQNGSNLEKTMVPNSIDELGILTSKYHDLLKSLKNQHIVLEEKVIERTKKLEIANKELETFSYSVSHDLRTPIRAIAGFSSILLEDCADKLDMEDQKNLNRIIQSANRMQEITNDLLKLSRINQQVLNREQIDLSHFVLFQLELLSTANPDRKVNCDIEQNLEVNADKGLIRLLIENLVGNAWKYTQHKQQTEIKFGFDVDKQAYFVKDNGVGFDMLYAKNLFLPFKRLHTDEEFEGSGIGLATSYRIIQNHGGTIWAESEIDKGTTFFFTL